MSAHDQVVIEQYQIDQLRTLATRLYSERRMDGDEMRDAAQLLDAITRSAIVLEDEATK